MRIILVQCFRLLFKVDIARMKKKLCASKQKQRQTEVASNRVLKRSLSDILKLPDRSKSVKTKDELLDKLDADIARKNKTYEESLAKMDQELIVQQQKKDKCKARMKKNLINKGRLQKEITETKLKKLFAENKDFLQSIYEGETFCVRHVAFHKSETSRQALFYKLVTEPFSDDQVDWTLKLMEQVWLKKAEKHKEMGDYIWKVLMPEFLVKIYANFFGMSQVDAENMIKETPVSDNSEEEL